MSKTKRYTSPQLTLLAMPHDVVSTSGADAINNRYTGAEALTPTRRGVFDKEIFN